jgi:hypothetical protein
VAQHPAAHHEYRAPHHVVPRPAQLHHSPALSHTTRHDTHHDTS